MDENIKELIKFLNTLKAPFVEKNIFSIGGRGHYENPISNILAFFIDPNEQHGFGDIFLQAFFEHIKKQPQSLEINSPPRREESTENGNRIDITIESDEWILIIENKIRHTVENPLDDYTSHLHKNYKNKKDHYFILLSIKKEHVPDSWLNITYDQLFSFIKDKTSKYTSPSLLNKWHIILRDFILNIESEYKVNKMQNERFNFAKESYASLIDAKNILNEYITAIKEKLITILEEISTNPDSRVYANQYTWPDCGIALRLGNSGWPNKSNIVFLLLNNGTYRLQFYIDPASFDGILTKTANLHSLGFHKIEKDIIGFSDFDNYESTLDCFRKTSLLIQDINR